MSLTQELAQEIWSSGQFRADLTRLEGANVAAELPRVNVTGLPAELDETINLTSSTVGPHFFFSGNR